MGEYGVRRGAEPMIERRALQLGSSAWAVVGFLVGLVAVRDATGTGRFVLIAACIAGPAAALLASLSLASHRDRFAGALLLASVVTPTVFAWVLNVPVLLIGLALLIAPALVNDPRVPRT
jgi:uncharacterized membrane protein YeaQ/YmgE (transglycosylase-associated protein family)